MKDFAAVSVSLVLQLGLAGALALEPQVGSQAAGVQHNEIQTGNSILFESLVLEKGLTKAEEEMQGKRAPPAWVAPSSKRRKLSRAQTAAVKNARQWVEQTTVEGDMDAETYLETESRRTPKRATTSSTRRRRSSGC